MTLKFELFLDFLTLHLPTKFHHPVFNSSEVITLTTNKQTNKQMHKLHSLWPASFSIKTAKYQLLHFWGRGPGSEVCELEIRTQPRFLTMHLPTKFVCVGASRRLGLER